MGMFSNPPTIHDEIPNSEVIQKVLEYRVQDSMGMPNSLQSILQGYGRTILIFIRHLHCGACMNYVTGLSENAKLKSTTTNSSNKVEGEEQDKSSQTKVVVIGHGSFEGIDWYTKNAETPFEMYVDQTKKLHQAFGFTHRYLGKPKDVQPEYFKNRSMFQVTLTSMKRLILSGSLAMKGGDIALLGGELVLDKDFNCIFIHRMRDTQDHTPIETISEFVLTPNNEE